MSSAATEGTRPGALTSPAKVGAFQGPHLRGFGRKVGYLTGATGCVGRNLVEELLRADWDVIVLHRKFSDLSRLQGCRVRFQEVDLHDPESTLNSLWSEADALFHVAGNTSHWAREARQQWKDNVLATRNLVEAALARRIKRFVLTSTGATLPYQGADERLAMRIKVGYVRTKLLAELEVYKAMPRGLDAVVLHPTIVMGAHDYNSYAQLFSWLKSGFIKAAFPGRIAFCHAADVARAHVQAFERGRPFERYVLGGEYTTWLDAFQRIARRIGCKPPKRVLSRVELKVASLAMSAASLVTGRKPMITRDLVALVNDAPDVSFSDKRKAIEDLGYESKPLDTMIDDCYNWLVQEGRL
jgi:nucleoside-diphosphate-sugar epimerase